MKQTVWRSQVYIVYILILEHPNILKIERLTTTGKKNRKGVKNTNLLKHGKKSGMDERKETSGRRKETN